MLAAHDLLAALRAADAGSRELSDAILLARGYRRSIVADEPNRPRWALLGLDWISPAGRWVDATHRPDPTNSVDDALKLIPAGMDWRIWSDPAAAVFPHGAASRFPGVCQHRGATPALAVCIAVLEAETATETAAAICGAMLTPAEIREEEGLPLVILTEEGENPHA